MNYYSFFSLFIRLITYCLLLFFILQVIEYDAYAGEMGQRFGENSKTEIAQAIFLFISSIISFLAAWKNKNARVFLISLGIFTLISFIREFNNYTKNFWFDGSWQIILYAIFIPYLIYAIKNFKKLIHQLEEVLPTFSFGILFSGLLITYFFSRIYGLHGIWQSLLGDNYIRDIKNISEEGIELLGYTFILAGTIEFLLCSKNKK